MLAFLWVSLLLDAAFSFVPFRLVISVLENAQRKLYRDLRKNCFNAYALRETASHWPGTTQNEPIPFQNHCFLNGLLVEMKWKLATNGHNWQTHNTGNGARDCYLRLLTEKNVVPLWGLAFVRIIWFFLKKRTPLMKLKAQGAPIASSNSLFFLALCLGCTQCSLHLGALLVFNNPKGPGNQPAVQLIAAPLPCDGPAWGHGIQRMGRVLLPKMMSLSASYSFFSSCHQLRKERRRRTQQSLGPSLGMSCFLLEKKMIKSESKEPSPPPRAVSSVAFRPWLRTIFRSFQCASLRSAKIPKGPGYQKGHAARSGA